MNHDLYLEILLKLSYIDIINICQSMKDYNQLCKSRELWYQLLLRDFNYDMDMTEDWTVDELKSFYEKIYRLVDATVIKIICIYMPVRKININLQVIYTDLFYIFGYFYNNTKDIADTPEYEILVDKEIVKIFNLFGIAFVKDGDDDVLYSSKLYYRMVNFYKKFQNIDISL